ncbi:hypothetical protein HS088_TW04G00837 [Tripterygium wilfordii]|uniref:B3 domain-containing protein n=1 Tax=Tripterygium wilfordii TaxID=458696 RepID=A0A7J7DRX0_TRIWF|nr:hypothetical protein HS088_TW04G00837 [Tripterygium wilfordii]
MSRNSIFHQKPSSSKGIDKQTGKVWPIEIELKKGDIENAVLVLTNNDVKTYILPYLSSDRKKQIKSEEKIYISMYDCNDAKKEYKGNGIFLQKMNSAYLLGWNEIIQKKNPQPRDTIEIRYNDSTDFEFLLTIEYVCVYALIL